MMKSIDDKLDDQRFREDCITGAEYPRKNSHSMLIIFDYYYLI